MSETQFTESGSSPGSDPSPASPAKEQTGVLRESVSAAGHAVRLARLLNSYPDARPYFAVTTARGARYSRYTPFLRRAEFLFERFLADVTDPALLAEGSR